MVTVYSAFQVGCPLPEHSNSRVTKEQTVNHVTCYLACVHVLFSSSHWSVSKSNVQEVDKQPEKDGTAICVWFIKATPVIITS